MGSKGPTTTSNVTTQYKSDTKVGDIGLTGSDARGTLETFAVALNDAFARLTGASVEQSSESSRAIGTVALSTIAGLGSVADRTVTLAEKAFDGLRANQPTMLYAAPGNSPPPAQTPVVVESSKSDKTLSYVAIAAAVAAIAIPLMVKP